MEIFDYDNILLLPRKCRVESRSECDAGVELGGRKFRLPVVPANMKTVVSEPICIWLAQNGYFYVMHRFDLDNVAFVKDMKARGLYASISLGVKKPDYDTVDQLVAQGLTPDGVVGPTTLMQINRASGVVEPWLAGVAPAPAPLAAAPAVAPQRK